MIFILMYVKIFLAHKGENVMSLDWLWIVILVLWLPAGALAYRWNRFLSFFDLDENWKIRRFSTPAYPSKKFYRNLAIWFGFFSCISVFVILLVHIIVYILVITVKICVYIKKVILAIAGK